MKRTLDALVHKAKNAFGKAKNLASMLSYPLALAGALSFSSPAVTETKGEVEITIESRNSVYYMQSCWEPRVNLLSLYVYADNTTETNSTIGLKWDMEAPMNFHLIGMLKKGDYVGSNGVSTNEDFFCNFPMDQNHNLNEISLTNNNRFVKSSEGPKQKKGLIGIFGFLSTSNEDGSFPLGPRRFKITNVKAYDQNGNLQSATDCNLTVQIIKNFGDLTNAPIIIQDINQGYVDLQVTHAKSQQVIEATDNILQNGAWTSIYTNTNYYPQYVTPWAPFKFRDRDARNHTQRFYRVRTNP